MPAPVHPRVPAPVSSAGERRDVTILSFQSRVSYGCVGHGAAEFTLRRIGHEVCPVDTVRLSNHPGYGLCRGGPVAAEDIADLTAGLDDIGVLARCRAVLTGYLGTVAAGEAALAAWQRVRAQSPGSLYCCDPVMGDRGSGLYVGDDLVAFFRNVAAPAADMLLPNHFELETLSERSLPTLNEALTAAQALRNRGPALVCVTSLRVGELGRDLGSMLVNGDGAWLVATPRFDVDAKGAGDVFAALLLGGLLDGLEAAAALERAVASTYAIVAATVAAGSRELVLVAAQDALVAPAQRFNARAIPAPS